MLAVVILLLVELLPLTCALLTESTDSDGVHEPARHKDVGVLTALAHVMALPAQARFLRAQKEGRWIERVAVCSSGHVRTFPLPGVHTSFIKHVMETIPWPNAQVDYFMDGILGNHGHSHGQAYPNESSDPALRQALENPRLNLKSLELYNASNGDCAALQAAWTRDGITDRWCNHRKGDYPHFYQVMFMDRCITKILRAPERYDVIIKTRPDVTLFAPMPWAELEQARHKVSYIPRQYGGGEDWFFVMPMDVVEGYWGEVLKFYMSPEISKMVQSEYQPDHRLFPKRKDHSPAANAVRPYLQRVVYPAVIVRHARRGGAECKKVHVPGYERHCVKAFRSGNMTWVNHTGFGPRGFAGPEPVLDLTNAVYKWKWS